MQTKTVTMKNKPLRICTLRDKYALLGEFTALLLPKVIEKLSRTPLGKGVTVHFDRTITKDNPEGYVATITIKTTCKPAV